MTSINRTAYPRLEKGLSTDDINILYKIKDAEKALGNASARGNSQRLTFLTLLKAYQHLGYFPALPEVPDSIRLYLAGQMNIAPAIEYPNPHKLRTSLHRYKETIRQHLQIRSYISSGRNYAETAMNKAAYTMSDPADLINVAIETLRRENIELPAFSTLGAMVETGVWQI